MYDNVQVGDVVTDNTWIPGQVSVKYGFDISQRNP